MPRFYIRSGDEAAVAAAAVALHVVLFVALVVLVAGLAHARGAVRETVVAVGAGDAVNRGTRVYKVRVAGVFKDDAAR